jgi:hypothetical protein
MSWKLVYYSKQTDQSGISLNLTHCQRKSKPERDQNYFVKYFASKAISAEKVLVIFDNLLVCYSTTLLFPDW